MRLGATIYPGRFHRHRRQEFFTCYQGRGT